MICKAPKFGSNYEGSVQDQVLGTILESMTVVLMVTIKGQNKVREKKTSALKTVRIMPKANKNLSNLFLFDSRMILLVRYVCYLILEVIIKK